MPLSKKMKAKINMIDLGILPAFTGREVTEMLESLSPDEKLILTACSNDKTPNSSRIFVVDANDHEK